VVEIDLSQFCAAFRVSEQFWDLPVRIQQDIVILSLGWLLLPFGRYILHASAVSRGGRAILFPGRSGAGKSSAALSLVVAGWDYVSDDSIVWQQHLGKPQAWALASGASLTPQSAARFGLCLESQTRVSAKHFFDVGGKQVAQAEPAALVFPRVSDTDRSSIERVDRLPAFDELLAASCGNWMFNAPAETAGLFRFVADMAATIPAYRLDAGRDVFGDGARLNELMAQAGVPGA
jgi:hypothetical protein